VVARALAKAPAERYPSAGDLGRAASAGAHGAAPTEPERSVAAGEAAPGAAVTEAPPARAVTEVTPAAAATAVDTPVTAPPPAGTPPAPLTPPAAPPPERRDGGRRVPIFIGTALALVAIGAVVALLLVSGGDDEAGREVADTFTVTNTITQPPPTQTTTTGGTTVTTAPPPPPPPPPDTQPFANAAYTARFPADWRRASDPREGFERVRFESPDRRAFVAVDRTHGATAEPGISAAGVEDAVRAAADGYRRIAFGPAVIGGRDGWQWIFSTRDDGTRIDLFFVDGGDGYAVLGGGSDFAAARTAAREVAASIRPNP
jgi:hypothetical protein